MSLNDTIAAKLRDMADVLEQQDEDGFRTAAYRRAADVVQGLDRPVDVILATEGQEGLVALPAIGTGIAAAIAEMVATARWAQLERLTGALEPTRLFCTAPGIGEELANRIHDTLHVDTLEQLEMAAHDGRLERVPGIGARRAAAIRAYLADRLARRRIKPRLSSSAPPIELLLQVDETYREKARAGLLKRIAPKRFNPKGEAWLPILHENIDPWRFTALYSNTRLAHDLGKTADWVVIYYHMDDEPEGQCTVVTKAHGPMRGRRVIRGREAECEAAYARSERKRASDG